MSPRPVELLEELLDTAYDVARAAGAAALAWRERTGLLVQEKTGPGDLVSQADRDAEQAARDVLARRRPQDAVTGEEAGTTDPTTSADRIRWLVDPIDGTTNYVYGRDDWTVSVAAVDADSGAVLAGVVTEPATGRATGARIGGGTRSDGRLVQVRATTSLRHVVADVGLGRAAHRPLAGRLFELVVPQLRDVRRSGSAALALVHVATGRADASWGPGLQPWDAAAGLLLVAEAGGVVGDLDGPGDGAFPASGNVLAAAPAVFEPLRRLLGEVYRSPG